MSRSTLNKRRSSTPNLATAPKENPLAKPTKRQKDQNEYFSSHFLLVAGLLPFIARDERKSVEKWLEKFETMGSTDDDRHIRNDYMWFLLVQLENGVVTLPFVNPPPSERLGPVSASVDKTVYEEVLQAANKRASLIEDEEIARQEQKKDEKRDEPLTMKPEDFLDAQPTPKFGFIVYGSCFSDHKW